MPSDMVSSQEMADLAMARSQVYGFLGALYNRIPDEKFAASLSSPETAAFLSSLGEAEDAPQDMREGLHHIEAYIHASKDKLADDVKTELAVERTRLLRGIKPGYGPPPPYESVYIPTPHLVPGQGTLNIKNIYAESGVVLPEEIHDQPDFVGFELDFMRYLAEQEAKAWAENDMQAVMATGRKEHAFLEEHVLLWIPQFCDLMRDQAQLDFYRGVAQMTKGFLVNEAHFNAQLVNTACVF